MNYTIRPVESRDAVALTALRRIVAGQNGWCRDAYMMACIHLPGSV